MRALLADAHPEATARGIALGMALYPVTGAAGAIACILRPDGVL